MRLELSIKVDYLPTWGAFEGVRELIQNARDGATEFGGAFEVWHVAASNKLIIENTGAVLPHEALLLGHTSKIGRTDLAGKFGEGLKLGVLALIRAGHAVRIRSGGEVWVPSIARSDRFQADVLVFQILKGREPAQRVRVEVEGIDAQTWAEMQSCFRFLLPRDTKLVETEHGTLLLDEALKGRAYVKGILVQSKGDFAYGYDFADADVDRDRKMIAGWDLQYKTRQVWLSAVAARPDLMEMYWSLLEAGSDEGKVSEYATAYVPEAVAKGLADRFVAIHGTQAVPVKSMGESIEVEHLGRRGIVCSDSLANALAKVLGTPAQIKEKLKEEVVARYSCSDLTDLELCCYKRAVRLVSAVRDLTDIDIDVVDFRTAILLGQAKTEGSAFRVLLARKILKDRAQTLSVLVHEVAHRNGGDAEKGHVAEIEAIWSQLYDTLEPV